MSYCVHCGVKLEASLNRCPLCNTPVINPNEPHPDPAAHPSPFPHEKGQIEVVKRKDLAILVFVTLSAIALVSGLLNIFVFKTTHIWSLYVIGACLLLYVIFLPAIINSPISLYGYLLLDGIASAVYLYIISFDTPSNRWLYGLGLPICALLCAVAITFVFLVRKLSSAFLSKALYVFCSIAVVCTGLELLVQYYYHETLQLTWSAIILAVCAVVAVALITILSRSRLRNAIRRRLHF